jgi:hypothetical protein
MADIRICGRRTGDVWISGVCDGCEFSGCYDRDSKDWEEVWLGPGRMPGLTWVPGEI